MAVGARVWPRSRSRLVRNQAETTLLAGSAYAAEDYGKSSHGGADTPPVKFEIRNPKHRQASPPNCLVGCGGLAHGYN
jgi:hypothetical protein